MLTEDTLPSTSITVDFISIIGSTIDVEVDHAVRPRLSVFASMTHHYQEQFGYHFWTVGGDIGVRTYLLGEAPEGLWVSAFGSWLRRLGRGNIYNYDAAFFAGVGIGYTFIGERGFSLSPGIGIGYATYLDTAGRANRLSDVAYRGRLGLGYAF